MRLIHFSLFFLTLHLLAQSPPDKPKTNTGEASAKQEKSDKSFPIGPYKNGQYVPAAGEEKQAEEAQLQENQDETRVNKMGPNKR